jgi:hypothetical protein
MARHEKESRRANRKAKQVANAKSRALRRTVGRALVLADVPEPQLLDLVPVGKVDQIVGGDVSWSVLTDKAQMLSWSVLKYNHIVTSDMHVRCEGLPKDQHPLHKYFASHSTSRAYAAKVGYTHNQVLVRGVHREIDSVVLHIGTVGLTDLHLGYIELANPNVAATNPIDEEQEFAGLGHGVLHDIIDNLRTFASSKGFKRITAYAVDRLRAEIFCRRGFSLNRDGFMFDRAMELNQQIPIVIDLSTLPNAAGNASSQ